MFSFRLTLCEVIVGRETNGLQFPISHELDVQVPPTGAHVRRALLPTVATDDGREAEGPVADLDVVELALPGRLDGVLLFKEQVDALPGSGCRRKEGRKAGREEVRWDGKSARG